MSSHYIGLQDGRQVDLGRAWGSAFLPNYLESLTVVSGLDLKRQGPKPGTALPEKCLGHNEWQAHPGSLPSSTLDPASGG